MTNRDYYYHCPLKNVMDKYDMDIEVASNISKDFTSLDFSKWLDCEWRDPDKVFDSFDERIGFTNKEIVSNRSYYASDLEAALKKYDDDFDLIVKYAKTHQDEYLYEPTFWEWCQDNWEWRDTTKKVKMVLSDSNNLRWIYE